MSVLFYIIWSLFYFFYYSCVLRFYKNYREHFSRVRFRMNMCNLKTSLLLTEIFIEFFGLRDKVNLPLLLTYILQSNQKHCYLQRMPRSWEIFYIHKKQNLIWPMCRFGILSFRMILMEKFLSMTESIVRKKEMT